MMLRHELGWVVIVMSERMVLMVRPSPTYARLIAEHGYWHILPWDNWPVTSENAPAVLAEADRAFRECPEHATFTHAYRATALYRLGRTEEADRAATQVPERVGLH